MRMRITFAFQLWWYFNTKVGFWCPFHEYYLSMYDKYVLKIEMKDIDPCEKVVFKVDNRKFWYYREAYNNMRHHQYVSPN